MKSIKRTIYYYELLFHFNEEFKPFDGDKYAELFTEIMHVVKNRLKHRYQVYGERIVMMQSISFDRNAKMLYGKLRCVRKDILPELMNTETDEAKGIEVAENEGLVETTHFLIDYSKQFPILSIEYNQFGSKIGDFLAYVNTLGIDRKCIEAIEYTPIVRDELKDYKRRMGDLSEFVVKVHKDNIAKVKELDDSLFSALDATVEHFESEYAIIKLKFDYKLKKNQSEIWETINNLLNGLIKKKETATYFNMLRIKAEDEDKNNYLETFDLLVDRIKSEVSVEKKEKYRTIVTADIIDKMKKEIIKKFNNYK